MTSDFIPDKKLEEIAYQTLARYEAHCGRSICAPVPVERIVEDTLNLNVLWDAIPEPDGQTILAGIDPSKHLIVLNENRRKVFEDTAGLYNTVLGHEGGHWNLHGEIISTEQPSLPGLERPLCCLYKSSGMKGQKETQANKFMSYLLLPSHLLLPVIKDVDLLVWKNLYQIRELFGVTITVLNIRLQNLGRLYISPDGGLYPSRAEFAGQQRLTP